MYSVSIGFRPWRKSAWHWEPPYFHNNMAVIGVRVSTTVIFSVFPMYFSLGHRSAVLRACLACYSDTQMSPSYGDISCLKKKAATLLYAGPYVA
jgi:hypothetical protein